MILIMPNHVHRTSVITNTSVLPKHLKRRQLCRASSSCRQDTEAILYGTYYVRQWQTYMDAFGSHLTLE